MRQTNHNRNQGGIVTRAEREEILQIAGTVTCNSVVPDRIWGELRIDAAHVLIPLLDDDKIQKAKDDGVYHKAIADYVKLVGLRLAAKYAKL